MNPLGQDCAPDAMHCHGADARTRRVPSAGRSAEPMTRLGKTRWLDDPSVKVVAASLSRSTLEGD
jgi:hypothetical protein